MRSILGLCTLAGVVWASPAWCALEDSSETKLKAAFDTLASGYDAGAAAVILDQMGDPAVTPDDWHAFYAGYFEGESFSAGHAEFWQSAIQAVQESDPAKAVTLAQASGQFAAEALAASGVDASGLDSFERALQWLANTSAWLGTAHAGPLRESLELALDGRPLKVEAMLQSEPVRARLLAMQACLLLSGLHGGELAPRLVTLPPNTVTFRGETGLWLFDNGALSAAHLASLASLYVAVPPALHQVEVLLVPAGLGVTASQAGLNTAGFVIDIDVQPMEATSNPSEFIPRVGYRAAPQFTLDAAARLMRAVQETQFAARPHLLQWRNEILARAGGRDERYLRRYISAQVYLGNPGELLPLTGYLWFLDSERSFLMGMEMMKVRVGEPIEALLLLADTLSGGGGNTLLFAINETGAVQSTLVPIRRTPLVGGAALLSGLAMGGERWNFDLNESGGVERYYRQYGG